MNNVHVHKGMLTRTKKQKQTKEMFDRLKEDSSDPEALRWLKECGISFVRLTKKDGKSIEIKK